MWFTDFQFMRAARGEWVVVYWKSGPRTCNECRWLVPNPRNFGWMED